MASLALNGKVGCFGFVYFILFFFKKSSGEENWRMEEKTQQKYNNNRVLFSQSQTEIDWNHERTI